MSVNGSKHFYDLAEQDDIIFISRREYEENAFASERRSRPIPYSYLDMHSLNNFINMPGGSYLKSPKDHEYERNNRSVINFNQLDYLDTEQSSQSAQITDSFPTQKHSQETVNLNGNNTTQNKSASSSLTEITPGTFFKSTLKPQKISLKDVINNTPNLDPYLLMKKKYMSKKLIRQQIQEQDNEIDLASLTYYQRKKNFIQKMREEDLILDWDSIKKDDQLYETMYVGGASRKRKSKKRDGEQTNGIQVGSSSILQPQPQTQTQTQQQQQNTSQGSSINNMNLYQKEAKSYRKVPRSSRYESQLENQIEEEKSLQISASIHERETKERDRFLVERRDESIFDGVEVNMVEVSTEELEERKEEFRHWFFLKDKYQNKSYIYISSKAQATIPQIRPIQDVRNSWVLKDLDSLLAYKKSPEYDSLETYMNKYFGDRTHQQVFSILKQNNFNLKNAIDYCNINSEYLKDYYIIKDSEAKKKSHKRKGEKKNYN